MWLGDLVFWIGWVLLLFLIVGWLNGDMLWVDGKVYMLEKYGFVWCLWFELVSYDVSLVIFCLVDSLEICVVYLFVFEFDVYFVLVDMMLVMIVMVCNFGFVLLFVSFGYYFVFVWLLFGGECDFY